MAYHEVVPSFLCDAMLGSLARWLRFFGYDCAYCDVSMADEAVAYRAEQEGRWLLTRDRELVTTGPPRSVLVRAETLDEQLLEVFDRFQLQPEAVLTGSRCAECNGELGDAGRDDVAEAVPPYVLRTAVRFRRCASCGRVYWPGTHGDRILGRMRAVCDRLRSRRAGSDIMPS